MIAPDDERLYWSGALSLERGPDWIMPWRVPHLDLDLYAPGNNGLEGRAAWPSGVRLCFATDAAEMLFATAPAEGAGAVDLYADGALVETRTFEGGEQTLRFVGLPGGMKVLELWLPVGVPFRLRGLEVGQGARVERHQDPRPRWIAYGSSITHCVAAASPSFTWPGVVARARGLELTSLGFGGQCHADPMIARLIRDRPAELVSVKMGINIMGGGTLNARTFRPAVLGVLATIRDGHPDIPLVVCSPIWCPTREREPNAAGMTLVRMREEIEAAVESFKKRGDGNIHYVDGLKLFDASLAAYLPDQLHPSAEGYKLMGANFLKAVFADLGVEVGPRTG